MRSRIAFLLVLLSWASDAYAVCMVSSPCERYWSSDAVFIGMVSDIQRTRVRSNLRGATFLSAERVQLSVVDSYRGVADRSVTVLNVLHSEAAEFRVGGTFFVYASRAEDGSLRTSLCAGTRPVNEAYEDREYARWIQTPRTRGRVFGTISHTEWDPGAQDQVTHPLPNGLVIVLTGTAGEWRARPERTGAFTRFLFDAIPPGTYKITLQVDGPYDVRQPVEVKVERPELCHEVSLSLAWKGVVHGRVIDAQGRSVPKAPVMILSGRPPLDLHTIPFEARATTDERGEFTHRFLPPGDYTLGMYIDATSRWSRRFPTIYFPGVTDPESARAVTVTLGSEIDVGDLQLPFDLEKVAVTGTVLLPDGSPCADCDVGMRAEGEYNDGFETDLETVTDGNGRFQLPGVRGRRYRIAASERIHEAWYDGSIVATAGHDQPIELELKESRP